MKLFLYVLHLRHCPDLLLLYTTLDVSYLLTHHLNIFFILLVPQFYTIICSLQILLHLCYMLLQILICRD
jgi:hypothetical protein